MTPDLSWSIHIGAISSKARQMAAWVLSVFHTRDTDPMLTLYKSNVRCHVEYCSPLWNPTKIQDIQELESVQRYFTKRIAGHYNEHYWDRLKSLSLMSLQRRRERYILIHMWKIRNGATSNDIEVCFTPEDRLGPLAVLPPLRKGCRSALQSLADRSFRTVGPKLWNAIPRKIRLKSSLDAFKSSLSTFLLTVPDKPPIRGTTSPNSNSILDWRIDRDASALFGSQEC